MKTKTKVGRRLGAVLLCAFVLISACNAAPAVNVGGGSVLPSNTIQVVGTGQAKGTPDIASIQMGVNITGSDLEQVIADANQAIEQLTTALVETGVNANDIRTSNYGIWPEDVYDRLTGEQTGERKYHADVTLDVTIRDIDRMGTFIQTGLDAGVNNIYGINFGLDERTALESSARAEAIVDARARAQELATGLGMNVGDAISISEGVVSSPAYGFGAAMFEGIGGGGAPISPGQSTVTLQVTVVFELVD